MRLFTEMRWRLVADERNVEDHAGRRDVGLECERSVDAGGRALRGARNHDRGADDGHAVLIDDPAGDLAGLLRLRAPAGREDDALVVDRIADVGVAEQFVECGADVLVRDRKGDVPVERNILGVVEEGVAALLLDLLHHRRNGGVRSLERDVFYLSLYGDGGDCERHAQRQCIRPDRAADSGCRGTV